MTTKISRNFSRVVTSAERGERLVPTLRAYLDNTRFPSFDIHIEGFSQRLPDGWFHPSEHPLWPERKLYYYLTEPDRWMVERMDPTSVMAVTQGKFWHLFMQHCIADMGQLEVAEHSVQDVDVGSRGDMDGILKALGPWPREGWEFKTSNVYKLQKLSDLASFMEMWPVYYAQAQEYLRLSGFTQQRVLFVNPEYPFPMKEVVVPYDPMFALRIRDKYARVRQAVADGCLPDPCCGVRSKEAAACQARGICPVGRAS